MKHTVGTAGVALTAALLIAGTQCVAADATVPENQVQSATSEGAFAAAPDLTEIPSLREYRSEAAELPAALKEAVSRDLGMAPEAYLQQAQVAAVADQLMPQLAEAGIEPDSVWLDGSELKVHTETAAQRELVTDLGAVPSTASVPELDPQALEQTFTAREGIVGGNGWSTNGALCSIGFNGRDASGTKVMGTAGHCFSGTSDSTAYLRTQTTPGTSGSGSSFGTSKPTNFSFGNGNDAGFVPVTNSALTTSPVVTQWNGSTLPVRGVITATVGAAICKSGRTTGWTCGRVLAVNQTIRVSDRSGGTHAVNSVVTDLCAYSGDSGGSMLIGSYAAAVVSSGSHTSSACTDTDGIENGYPLQGSTNSMMKLTRGWEPAIKVETPRITQAVAGAASSITGTVPNAAPGTKVSLYLDGSSTATATVTVGTDGSWSFAAPTVPTSGSHTFTVVASYLKWSKSAGAAGTLAEGSTAAVGGSTSTGATGSSLKLITSVRPKILGTVAAGRRVDAHVYGSKWKPSHLKFNYRWMRNGVPIGGAVYKTYTVKKKDVGKKLTVKVTAKKTGYKTTSRVARPVIAKR